MIKKMVFGLLAAVLLVSGLAVGSAFAAESPARTAANSVGPYEGVFTGVLYGDNNSRAPIALAMTHRDGVVNGKLYLGEGFYVDAGRCGGTTIPAMSQSASGRTLVSDPSKLPSDHQYQFQHGRVQHWCESQQQGLCGWRYTQCEHVDRSALALWT